MTSRLGGRYKPFGVTIMLIVFWLGGISWAAAADKFPASTFLPFDGRHSLELSVAPGDRWIYPMGDNYLQVGYQEGLDSGDRDMVVQKLDKNGQAQWKEVYELDGHDTLVILHAQKTGFVLGIHNRAGEEQTARLLQCDSSGQVVWQRPMPFTHLTSIGSTNDKGLIAAGYSLADEGDIHLVKMDDQGLWQGESRNSKRWEKVIQQTGDQSAVEISQLLDEDDYNDGYLLTGGTDSGSDGQDILVMRLDAYGEIEWSRNLGTGRDDTGITVVPLGNQGDQVMGFILAGNTTSPRGDQDLYLAYIDKYGTQQSWPGYMVASDGRKERCYGGSGDQRAVLLTAVPESFKEDRKLRGETIKGHGGAVLVGADVEDEEVLIVRIDETGHVLWEKRMEIPGENLLIGTVTNEDDEQQYLAYSMSYPGDRGGDLQVHALRIYLRGLVDEDKAIPQDDQAETNYEAVEWEKRTLKYEALRDISKEIKDLLSQQPFRPVTAGSGRGEINWPDTSYYLGHLVIGKADGVGTLLFPNGVWYRGAWKNNMFTGTGLLRFPTGESYQGDFKDHMMHGQGTFHWPTGENYRGEFKYNQRDGQGTFTWPGGVAYQGSFAKGDAEGPGSIRWANGERYEGQMKDGQASGPGSYYFPSGERYRGEFKSLAFEGVGAYYWADGGYYVGEFKEDRLHGEGYYVWPNGVMQWGYWKDDRYLGIHKEIMENKGKW